MAISVNTDTSYLLCSKCHKGTQVKRAIKQAINQALNVAQGHKRSYKTSY